MSTLRKTTTAFLVVVGLAAAIAPSGASAASDADRRPRLNRVVEHGANSVADIRRAAAQYPQYREMLQNELDMDGWDPSMLQLGPVVNIGDGEQIVNQGVAPGTRQLVAYPDRGRGYTYRKVVNRANGKFVIVKIRCGNLIKTFRVPAERVKIITRYRTIYKIKYINRAAEIVPRGSEAQAKATAGAVATNNIDINNRPKVTVTVKPKITVKPTVSVTVKVPGQKTAPAKPKPAPTPAVKYGRLTITKATPGVARACFRFHLWVVKSGRWARSTDFSLCTGQSKSYSLRTSTNVGVTENAARGWSPAAACVRKIVAAGVRCDFVNRKVAVAPGEFTATVSKKVVNSAMTADFTTFYNLFRLPVAVWINGQAAYTVLVPMDGNRYAVSKDGISPFVFKKGDAVKLCEDLGFARGLVLEPVAPVAADGCLVAQKGGPGLEVFSFINRAVEGVRPQPPPPAVQPPPAAPPTAPPVTPPTPAPKTGAPGPGTTTPGQAGGPGAVGSPAAGSGPTCRDASGNVVPGTTGASGNCPGAVPPTTGAPGPAAGSPPPPPTGNCLDPATGQSRAGAKDQFGYCV